MKLKLASSWPRSRVALRIVALFILCAVVPTSILGWISYRQVTEELMQQAFGRLRQESKSHGMVIYDRLLSLKGDLDRIASMLPSDVEVTRNRVLLPSRKEWGGRFHELTLLRYSGQAAFTPWPTQERTPLTDAQLNHLRAGKTLLIAMPRTEVSARMLMSRAVTPNRLTAGILLAEVDGGFLWGAQVRDVLPSETELLVLDQQLHILYSTLPETGIIAPTPFGGLSSGTAKGFTWQTSQEEYLAGSWTMPMRFTFLSEPWIIVLSQTKASALVPLNHFQQTFGLVVALAVGVVALLSLTQIRRSLGPLAQLQEGTRRIAQRDFTSRVMVSSGDEFEELGASFNTMAERLGRQFQMLETMSAIGRAILSAHEPKGMVEVVLSRTRDALACDSVGVALAEPDQAAPVAMSTRHFFGPVGTGKYEIELTGKDLETLKRHPHHLLVTRQEIPAYLGPLAQEELNVFLILPILLQQSCSGFIVLGYRRGLTPSSEDIASARQFADQVSVALTNAREISQRLEADAKVYFLANYDSLTHLANRQLFHHRVAHALHLAKSDKRIGSVLLVNLDRFQRINDMFGPRAGDHLLEEVAERLSMCARKSDSVARYAGADSTTVGRLGNDQFGVLLTNLPSAQDSAKVAQHILDSINKPYQIGDKQVTLTASIGIGLLPSDGDDADTLVRNADTALRAAKERGRNAYQFYSESMNLALANRMNLEHQLRGALERNEFLLYYQPQVDVRSGDIVGVEALIRWQHPQRGLVPPAEFIPVAEEEDLIISIGQWVLGAACTQQRTWREAGLAPFEIAINISSLQFRQPDLMEKIMAILQETGADPRYLELELTETVLMNDAQSTVAPLKQLKEMGIRLAIDDFGTGYSSLAYLNRFPIDTIKIDRAFVNEISPGSEGAAITSAIIAMAHALKLHVVAEGVETNDQLAFLRRQGCERYQGQLFSKPVPPDHVTNLLRAHLRPGLAKRA